MRIAIIGGHLTPALSVIEETPKEDTIIFIGRRHALEGDKAESLEYKEITKRGIIFVDLKTGRLQRSFTRRTIPSVAKLPKGFWEAVSILMKVRPDVVIGFGGYVSLPVGIASYILRIPLIIHEQTQEAGLSNKILAKFAKKVCISFETSRKFFPRSKTVLTGNPIRKAIRNPKEKFRRPEDLPLIFVTGGSLGSHAINIFVENCLSELLSKYILVHQTGAAQEFNDFERLSKRKEKMSEEKKNRYLLFKHLAQDKMGVFMKDADLVVARAGINTVTEIITLRKKAFLIPLPFSQRNEQLKNALLVKRLGFGEVGEQNKLTSEEFVSTIKNMLGRKDIDPKEIDIKFPKNAARKILEVAYATAKKAD